MSITSGDMPILDRLKDINLEIVNRAFNAINQLQQAVADGDSEAKKLAMRALREIGDLPMIPFFGKIDVDNGDGTYSFSAVEIRSGPTWEVIPTARGGFSGTVYDVTYDSSAPVFLTVGSVVEIWPTVERTTSGSIAGEFYLCFGSTELLVDIRAFWATVSANNGSGNYTVLSVEEAGTPSYSVKEINNMANVPIGTGVLIKYNPYTTTYYFEYGSKVAVDSTDPPDYLENQVTDDNTWIEVAKVGGQMKTSHIGPSAKDDALDLLDIALAGGVISWTPLKPQYDAKGHLTKATDADDVFTFKVKASDNWLSITADGGNGAQIEHLGYDDDVLNEETALTVNGISASKRIVVQGNQLKIDAKGHVSDQGAGSASDYFSFTEGDDIAISVDNTDEPSVTIGVDWTGITGHSDGKVLTATVSGVDFEDAPEGLPDTSGKSQYMVLQLDSGLSTSWDWVRAH